MVIQTTIANNHVIVSLKGGLRYADRQALTTALNQAVGPDCTKVLLDLHEVHFIDSAALSILATTHQRLKQQHKIFGLLKPTEQVMRLLTISGIHKMMPIFQSEQEASTATTA